MASWAVILKPNEAFFCPLVPIPPSPPPDLSSLNEVLQLLGGELAEAIRRDPQIHASIWQKKRIDIRWSRQRPDFLEKIETCLRRNRVLACGIWEGQAELIAHQLSEDVCDLYRYNIRLTGSILDYLAKNVTQEKSCLGNIHFLKQNGLTEEEIGALADKNILVEAAFILDRFREAGVSQPKECVLKLTQSRIHFNEVHEAISAMFGSSLRLTAPICEELVARPGFGIQLARAATQVSCIQNIGGLFVGSYAQVNAVIWVIHLLRDYSHFESNVDLLNRHKNRVLEIKDTLAAMSLAGIYPTPNFYSLLFPLIETLHPIDLGILQSMVNHSEAIQAALDHFRCADLELTKDGLLFLIAKGEGARAIGEHAFGIARLHREANRANIQLLPEDAFLVMAHAKYADAICSTISYLNKDKIPLTRDDFLLLVENRDLTEKLSLILKNLNHELIGITRDNFFRLLETGGTDETVQLIKENNLAKRCASWRAPFS